MSWLGNSSSFRSFLDIGTGTFVGLFVQSILGVWLTDTELVMRKNLYIFFFSSVCTFDLNVIVREYNSSSFRSFLDIGTGTCWLICAEHTTGMTYITDTELVMRKNLYLPYVVILHYLTFRRGTWGCLTVPMAPASQFRPRPAASSWTSWPPQSASCGTGRPPQSSSSRAGTL